MMTLRGLKESKTFFTLVVNGETELHISDVYKLLLEDSDNNLHVLEMYEEPIVVNPGAEFVMFMGRKSMVQVPNDTDFERKVAFDNIVVDTETGRGLLDGNRNLTVFEYSEFGEAVDSEYPYGRVFVDTSLFYNIYDILGFVEKEDGDTHTTTIWFKDDSLIYCYDFSITTDDADDVCAPYTYLEIFGGTPFVSEEVKFTRVPIDSNLKMAAMKLGYRPYFDKKSGRIPVVKDGKVTNDSWLTYYSVTKTYEPSASVELNYTLLNK